MVEPEAKRFRRWVTNEVLPAIRKTGAYITDSILDADDPWALLEIAPTEGKKLRDAIRALHPERSLAEHYNPLAMDPALLNAHKILDREVDRAFVAPKRLQTERQCQELLFANYARLVEES